MSETTAQPPGFPFLWLLIIYSLAWAALQPGSWLLRGSVPGRQAPLCKYLLNLWVWHTHWCLIGQNKSHDPRVKVGGNCSRSCIAKGVVHWGPSLLQFTMFTLHCHTFEREHFFSHCFSKSKFCGWRGRWGGRCIIYCLLCARLFFTYLWLMKKIWRTELLPILEMTEIQRTSINSWKSPN